METEINALFDRALEVKPHASLVFHGTTASALQALTLHGVKDGKIGVGRYVDAQEVIDMLTEATQELRSSDTGHAVEILPEHILVNDKRRIVWYRKRERRMLHLAPRGGRAFRKEVEWPPMLFIVEIEGERPTGLYLFALASNTRPTASSMLYALPATNISTNGHLCQGTAVLPKSVTLDTLREVEATFFDADGTHTNTADILRGVEKTNAADLMRYWREKAKSDSRVKASELHPYKTLGEVLA